IEPTTRAGKFLEQLRKIQHDRGKMAALRRGLSDATQREAWPVIASLGQDIGKLAPRIISALYAHHSEDDPKLYSFGVTCRRIALKDADGFTIPESYERRFRRLLACDSDEDVAGQLKAWIRLAAAKGVGVNYEQLFWDLDLWKNRADQTKLQWARDFWSPRRDADEPATPEAPTA
ncbi:MAG: type I-E CRISPR-associated protein Cse2/CasB, partial [Chthoniobacteraceae bacterium]